MGRSNAEFANGWDHEKVAKYHKIDAMAKGGTTPQERAAWESKRQAFAEKHGGGVPPGHAGPQAGPTRPQPQAKTQPRPQPQAQPRPQRPQASSGETWSKMDRRHTAEWVAMSSRHSEEYRAARDASPADFGNLFSRHDNEKAGLFNRHDREKQAYFRNNPL